MKQKQKIRAEPISYDHGEKEEAVSNPLSSSSEDEPFRKIRLKQKPKLTLMTLELRFLNLKANLIQMSFYIGCIWLDVSLSIRMFLKIRKSIRLLLG